MNQLRLTASDCRPHPLLAAMAMEEDALNYLRSQKHSEPEKEAARIKKLEERLAAHEARRASIAAIGVQEPVKVIRDGDGEGWLIVDGRHRVADAALAGRDFPASEVSEDVNQIIQTTFYHTRPRAAGAKAWLAVNTNPAVVDSKPGRPGKNKLTSIGIRSRTELALACGVSAPTIDQACDLYKSRQNFIEAGHPEKALKIDLSIAAGNGLGGILAGLEGRESLPKKPDGSPTKPKSSYTGALRTITTMQTQLKEYESWGDAGKASTLVTLGDWFRKDPAASGIFQKALDLAAKPRLEPAEMMAAIQDDNQ